MLKKCLFTLLIVINALSADYNPYSAVTNSNQLGERLYLQLHKKEGNLIFSPYGISTLLAIAYYASSNETKKEFENDLQFADNQNIALVQFARLLKQVSDPRITLGSSIWLQSNEIKNKTAGIVQKYFGPVFHNVNFNKNISEITTEINKWAVTQTNGKIAQLLQESNLSPDLNMLLIDLFYLQASWQTPFLQEATKEEIFYIDELKTKPVKMMHVTGEFPYSSSERFFLVELPLAIPKGGRKEISFYLLQPKVPEWMLSVEESFDIKTVLQAARGTQKKTLSISLPIFDISELLSLKESLQGLGLQTPFLETANFSKVTQKSGKGIDKFFHVAPLSLNEFGVEAKEMPAKPTTPKKRPKDLPQFNFNRPFLFFVMDKATGVVLLMGRISEP